MPFGLKSIWFQLVTELAVIVWFVTRFWSQYAAGVFDGPDGLVTLGRTMLWFMAATVVAIIIVHIIGLIAFAIAEGGEEPDTTTDERDEAIEARGEKVSNTASGIGLVGGVVLMTLGQPVPIVMAAIFIGCLTAAIIGNIVKLRAYAEG